MSSVDKSLLLRKLAELETYHDQLREYAALTVHAYSADWKMQRIVERTLQMMCETSADFANHLIAASGMGRSSLVTISVPGRDR